ncbi:MAG: hypothetical protein CO125_07810 [Hydrogenophilales bacterium CG_4_9_14_3_um_filter_59_35]|nr:MAG: hypothetical protein COW70_00760 [Hydrogenophilales bacterium CG18_big_fil_WC_8_21_14_2_50_58_12]PIY00208.1 MAG: hypothetical protein COZ23_08850 [Hydrogenophilales bacterium CG_4_10_14_3_um_filter_58_23]PJB06065.1 MAG: hypothetical protein CO125_07810 [Hydrogenophilales bacterium CG_4_9_14_3_um_filter_59_35]
MKIEIDEELQFQIQALSPVGLRNELDYGFFLEWLVKVGIGTIRAALVAHPELTLGDLAMMQFRNDVH